MRTLASLAGIATGAVAAGYLCLLLGIPLPWMVGPLLLMATLNGTRFSRPIPNQIRGTGQILVATAIGLHFTPDVLLTTFNLAGYMIAGAVFTVILGCLTTLLLQWLSRCDRQTAFFSSFPAAPVEMAQLAESYQSNSGAAALAQTLRMAIMILTIPPFLHWLSGIEADGTTLTSADTRWLGLGLLVLITTVAGVLFHRLNITTAFFLGPLAAAVGLTAAGVELSGVPAPIVAAGQVMLGLSLGARIDWTMMARERRFILASLVGTAVLIIGCGLAGWAIAAVTGLPLNTMILALAPGGIPEMAVTAKALELDVALVTAFHIARLFIVLPIVPVAFRLVAARRPAS